MVTKPKNAHKFKNVYYAYILINTVCLLHASATPVTILGEMRYKEYITQVYEQVHRCKIYIYVHLLILLPSLSQCMVKDYLKFF